MKTATMWKFVAVMLLLGALSGVAWSLLAEPAMWEVTESGIILTEAAASARFGVVVLFVVIGAVVSLGWGWLFAGRLHDRGPLIVPVAVFTALAAGLIAFVVGRWLGPSDPRSLDGLTIGGLVPQQLSIDSAAPLLVWPIAVLVPVIWRVYFSSDPRHRSRSGQ